jgi:hypothetical protein
LLILGLAAFEAWEANAFPVMLLFLPFFASAIAAAHLQADRGSGALDFILKQNLSLPQILWLRFAFGLILPSLGSLLVLLPLLVRGQLQAGQLVWYWAPLVFWAAAGAFLGFFLRPSALVVVAAGGAVAEAWWFMDLSLRLLGKPPLQGLAKAVGLFFHLLSPLPLPESPLRVAFSPRWELLRLVLAAGLLLGGGKLLRRLNLLVAREEG